MDGENNGKPCFLMDDLGGKTSIFRNIHLDFLYNKNPPVGSKSSGISQWHGLSGHVFWGEKISTWRAGWTTGLADLLFRTLKHKLENSTKGKVRGK